MIPTVSQICCLNSPFETDIEDFAAGHCRSIEIWLTKLETYLQNHTLEDVRFLLQRFEVQTPVASFQGGLLASQGERRSEAWASFIKRLDLCQAVGIGTLVVACDVPGPLVQSTIERVQQSLVQAAQEAGKRKLRIAVEFQSNSAFGNNLQTMAALVGEVGSPHLGICLDVFHWHCGPSKLEDLGYLNPGNLFHVQLCDVADTVRELATDSQRIMPGEGDIPIAALLDGLKQVSYTGTVSLELMNPQLWQIPARQLGEIGMTSLRKLLGQAQM